MAGIAANGSLALIKGVAGVLGNSYALIADAVESASDVVGSIVVYMGLKVAAAPPTERYPYGKGRAETVSAVVVALMLFVAATFIGIESVKEIRTPHHAPAPFTLIVLVGVIVIKEGLFRFVGAVGDEVQSSAVKTDAWHHRSDAITSAAAFIGISIALWKGPGYESADDWAALLAAAIIVINAYLLLKPAIAELLDHAPDSATEGRVREIALTVEGVRGTHHCHVRKLGFDHYVDLDVLVDGRISVQEGHDIAHRVQDAVRDAMPHVTKVLVHMEPDDDPHRTENLKLPASGA